jgi:lysophospholipase L1-like esterase
MKYTTQKLIGLSVLVLLTSACDPEFANEVGDSSNYSNGSADFSTYVAIGDSLTAGYADSALYRDGQIDSFPAILAQQFAEVGGGAFSQPLMPTGATGSLTLAGNPLPVADRFVLVPTATGPSPGTIDPVVSTEIGVPPTGTFNNMGVPGAKSFHLGLVGYGNADGVVGQTANPFYVRFASIQGDSSVVPVTGTSVILDTLGQAPTFFTLWIGNNDILSYATTGGIGVDQNAANNLDPTTYSSNDITDDLVFASAYSGYVAALTASTDTRGVLINIPNVTSIPYFTTVPHNAIPLNAEDVASLTTLFADPYNAGIAIPALGLSADEITSRTISFATGQNAIVIEDEDLTDLSGIGLRSYRQATAADFVLLPASSKLGDPVAADATMLWGLTVGLEDGDVLTENEAAGVNAAQAAYNATIAELALANGNLVLFDAAAALAGLKENGINYGTGAITSTFATGGGFSLDGVHPTARGYAVVSNLIIDAINSGFGANIPTVDPGSFTTVFYQ